MVYEKPEMIVLHLEDDVICTSGLTIEGQGGNGLDTNVDFGQ